MLFFFDKEEVKQKESRNFATEYKEPCSNQSESG